MSPFRNPGGAIAVRRSPLPLALVAGFALFGGGCGGDPSPAPAPASPAAPPPTPAPAPPAPSPAPPPDWTRPPVTHRAPLFPENAGGSGREGFLRIVNYSHESGAVSIAAFDGDGREYGPVVLAIEARQTVHLGPEDLVRGNPAGGVSGATGSGWGDGRLELTSDLDLMVLSYIRHPDGFLTAMHNTVPKEGNGYHVRTFHPGSEPDRTSRLRLTNTGRQPATLRIRGIDDRAASSGEATVSVPAGATREFTAAELESGTGVAGALGIGAGMWRLVLESEDRVAVMNLLEGASGYLANLSAVPRTGGSGAWAVPLFPGSADPRGRRGLLRIINHSPRGGEVRIAVFDDGGRRYPPFTARVGAGQAVHLDSGALEAEASAGANAGSRHLVVSGDPDIEVLSYLEHPDGFLTATHEVAPLEGHRVSTFLPGSRLRLVNAGDRAARVTVAAVDDRGASPASVFETTVAARAAREFTAAQLEFGDAPGGWRLAIDSEETVEAMSLLESPTGHLSNLSSEPPRDPVLVEDHYAQTSRGNAAGVAVSVVDAQGFDPGTHGQRITDTFFEHTRHAALVQTDGWGTYALNGSGVDGGNADGYVIHALTHGGGVFWTATDVSPLYLPHRTQAWFVKHGRPFKRAVREFANWRRDRDVLFVSSLENATCAPMGDDCVSVYCDDFEADAEEGSWIPLCGEFDDYVAHSGVGIDTVLFAGALDPRFDEASGAIRADGVFAPHTIYTEARDTSHATAVLAAYAVNLSFGNPSWSAARLKRELLALAREETVEYHQGGIEAGVSLTERRTIKVIRPGFAP